MNSKDFAPASPKGPALHFPKGPALLVVAAVALAAGSLRGAGPAGPVDFVAHDIDANFRGG
jgi:hypothetical protein